MFGSDWQVSTARVSLELGRGSRAGTGTESLPLSLGATAKEAYAIWFSPRSDGTLEDQGK
jgi:hypothetical protein